MNQKGLSMVKLIEKLINYINASPENRTQVMLLLAFFIIPVIGLTILYVCMYIFVLK
jgi:hypothetical protein